MILKFIRSGQWWRATRLMEGKLDSYSFVWPMVIHFLKDQLHPPWRRRKPWRREP